MKIVSNLNLENVNIILFRIKFKKIKFQKLTYKDDFFLIIGFSSTYIIKSQFKLIFILSMRIEILIYFQILKNISLNFSISLDYRYIYLL